MNPSPEQPWEIDAHTRLLAVIGDPVAHSLSPAMHNLALRELGLNFRYLALHVVPERLEEAARGFAAMGMAGFSATIPHKERLIPLMDRLDPLAAAIGAVNTVVIDASGKMVGYNTDGYGFLTSLAQLGLAELRGRRVVVVGAGGAARAVVASLLNQGVGELTLVNRTPRRAELLLEQFAPLAPPATPLQVVPLEGEHIPLEGCDLLVNTSSLGLHGETIPQLEVNRLPAGAVVQEIVYGPRPTPLVTAATRRGLTAGDGLAMLVHQGAMAFQLWTGQAMPTELVSRYLRQRMGEK